MPTEAQSGLRIAAIGDTQPTLFLERALLRREQNRGTAALVRAMAGMAPDIVVHLGDMVAVASRRSQWQRFDALFEPMAGALVLPAMGNHDYWGAAQRAAMERNKRFPYLTARTWRCTQAGPLALVFLDTNRGPLGRGKWKEQSAWFAEALAHAQEDAKTRGIIVLAHHPPFTNSTVTRDDIAVQQAFLEPFFQCPKALAMLSGHTHAYERFEVRGKAFIVSGGGGGPRVRLRRGAKAPHADLSPFSTGAGPCPLHFLMMDVGEREVLATMHGLDEGTADAKVCAVMDEVRLPLAV